MTENLEIYDFEVTPEFRLYNNEDTEMYYDTGLYTLWYNSELKQGVIIRNRNWFMSHLIKDEEMSRMLIDIDLMKQMVQGDMYFNWLGKNYTNKKNVERHKLMEGER